METLEQARARKAALEREAKEIEDRIAKLELDEAERLSRMRTDALSMISQIAALKVLVSSLSGRPDIVGTTWVEAYQQIPPQALPREANIAKRYDISETEASNAKAEGREAVKGLSLPSS